MDEVYSGRTCEQCPHRTQAAIADARGGTVTRTHEIKPYDSRGHAPAQKGQGETIMPKSTDERWDKPAGEVVGGWPMDRTTRQYVKEQRTAGKSPGELAKAIGIMATALPHDTRPDGWQGKSQAPSKPKPAPMPAAPPSQRAPAPVIPPPTSASVTATPPRLVTDDPPEDANLLDSATADDLREFVHYTRAEKRAEHFLGVKQFLDGRRAG